MAIAARLFPTRSDTFSCVMPSLSSRCWYPSAISMALRSSRCMFSTSAISITFSSVMVRIYAGMAVSPTICDALHRLSPAIIIYLPSASCLTVIGCMMPISLIDAASSCSACSSKSRRGWLGLATMRSTGTSLMVDEPCVLTSSVDIRASRPRPSALPLLPVLYFLCTAILLLPAYYFLCQLQIVL